MSTRLYQNIILQMKDILGKTIGVIDENDCIVACSIPQRIGEIRAGVRDELLYATEPIVLDGMTYRLLNRDAKNDAILFIEGDDQNAARLVNVLAVAFSNIKSLYDEHYDKGSFIKNIMLDNIMPGDIYVKSRELHFATEEIHAVLLIKFHGQPEQLPLDIIQNLYPDRNHDYVISIGETEVVLVKETTRDTTSEDLEELATTLATTLSTEYYAKVSIGIPTVVDNIRDLSSAYKEARIALEVSKVFDTEKTIISYVNLGIGRLVYQLPIALCEVFLKEVFKQGALESLDRETLQTVQAFFENNLNVSETSRKLFVHRNTLVYRLEKIRKLTGLDLRQFDHAVTFKVALMVKKYLVNKPMKF